MPHRYQDTNTGRFLTKEEVAEFLPEGTLWGRMNSSHTSDLVIPIDLEAVKQARRNGQKLSPNILHGHSQGQAKSEKDPKD